MIYLQYFFVVGVKVKAQTIGSYLFAGLVGLVVTGKVISMCLFMIIGLKRAYFEKKRLKNV